MTPNGTPTKIVPLLGKLMLGLGLELELEAGDCKLSLGVDGES